ncbi:MAG: hypothetical protein NDI94_02990 [Candidatus Woesearchaeota archaeon]|nr:hypothetical protein [Candidatus Woesearchaeota archaeon]
MYLEPYFAARISSSLYHEFYEKPQEESWIERNIHGYGRKIEAAIHELHSFGIDVKNGSTIDVFLEETNQILNNSLRYTKVGLATCWFGAPGTPFDLSHIAIPAAYLADTVKYAFTDRKMLQLHGNLQLILSTIVLGSVGYFFAAPFALKKSNPNVAKIQTFMLWSLLYRQEEKMFSFIDSKSGTEFSGEFERRKREKAAELFIPAVNEESWMMPKLDMISYSLR